MAATQLTPRVWQVGATAVVTVAAIGYLSGTRASDYVPRVATPVPSSSAIEVAPRYLDLRDMTRGPNANLYSHTVGELQAGLPSALDSVAVTPAERAETVAARRERRAFDGAPPVIPHRVRQSAAPDCLACHERGAKIANRVAPMMSHRRFASCTQCHVEQHGERFRTVEDFAPPNEFVGYRVAGSGTRAWEGAPPTIPHPTQMRENCGSCHGVAGPNGLRTPHAERQSCTQCHAPAARLDQRPTESFPPWLRPSER